MKNIYTKILSMPLLLAFLFLASCDDDDDSNIIDPLVDDNNFVAVDQDVTDDMITVNSVTVEEDSWIVVHADDGMGAPMVPDIISVPKWVEAGTSTDVQIELKDGADPMDGDMVWIMLHSDTGTVGMYEFDGTANSFDPPITNDDGDVVVSPITLTSVETGVNLMVENQHLSQNMIWVESVDVKQDAWIVVHSDNGSNAPTVPEIISEPKMVEAGVSTGVWVMLDGEYEPTDGETLWVMLHSDTGTVGMYEFDSSDNSADKPIIKGGDIIMSPIEIMSPSITAQSQAVDGNSVLIDEVWAARDGWLVIHNDNGSGGIVLPGIIGKTQVSKGLNENVVVTLDESANVTAGQKLFPMLHVDTGVMGEYEFDGSANSEDKPEFFGYPEMQGGTSHIIVTSFDVL